MDEDNYGGLKATFINLDVYKKVKKNCGAVEIVGKMFLITCRYLFKSLDVTVKNLLLCCVFCLHGFSVCVTGI